MLDTMTDTAPPDLATAEDDTPYDVRTIISGPAGRALAQLQLDRGLTYPTNSKRGPKMKKWPLAALCTEILEQQLLGKA
jgi:hypothetical protein